MRGIKELFKNQKKAVEGLLVCLISGWMASSISRGVFFQISELDSFTNINLILTLGILIISSVIVGMVYFWRDDFARIIMFLLISIFTMACAYNGYNIQWTEYANNSIGKVCFSCVLCFVTVLAFIYVKEDIFKLFKKIKITKKIMWISVAVIGLFVFAFVGVVTVLRYVTYSNSAFDFGIFTQMYEYMKQTGMINTTVERNYLFSHFGVHFSPVYYLGLPVYFIFSSPITIQLIQAVMIALPLIPIVLLCRHYKMSNWMTIAIALLYTLYPATISGTFYDIHENCFLTFFILMTIWAVEKNKNIAFAVFTILTLSVKEDAAFYILVIGTYFFFSRREKKRGIILMIVSVIYFAIAVSIVSSFGVGIMESDFKNLYADINGGLEQIAETILLNPAYVLGQAITNITQDGYDKIEYLLLMMVPIAGVLFTTGKKYSRYILLVPFVVMNVITTYRYLHHIGFQYNFGTIALFLYIIIMNLSEMKVKKAKTMASVSVICAGIMFVGCVLPNVSDYVGKYQRNKEIIQTKNEALAIIPEDASVCASTHVVPHLSKHLELYDQVHMIEPVYTEYLAIDKSFNEPEDIFEEMLETGQYELVYNADKVIEIYKKK